MTKIRVIDEPAHGAKVKDLSKPELIKVVMSYNSIVKRISKLYATAKMQLKYLERRNEILEKRILHFKEYFEKRNGCKLTFSGIDRIIKKEERLKKREKIKFEIKGEKDGREYRNAKDERVQS